MRLKKLLTFVSFIIINLSSINLSYSIEPDIFVQSTVNRASQVLSDNITKIKKIEKLKDIAKETVDINGIGLYTLGLYRKKYN
jgi:phospholipid transport system substrate-binding protein